MINIGGDANDSSYRYKMPKLVTKIEGRGNGIKTVIVNMVDIAKALHVPPSYPTKFFGFELGAQSKFNENTERAIVNGSHNAGDLATTLQKFIHRYILCPRCALPEINHHILVRKQIIEIDCAACGHNGNLKWSHKLVSFIFNQQEKKKSKRVKDKKKEKVKQRNTVEQMQRAQAAVPERRRKETWQTEWDFSKEAVENRRKAEFNQLDVSKKQLSYLNKDRSLSEETPVNILKYYIDTTQDCSVEGIASEVRRLQLSRGLDEPQKVKVLLEAIIDCSDSKNIPKEYEKHQKLLKLFANDRTSKLLLIYCVEDQLGGLKQLIRMPFILKVLYDQGVLDDDTIIEWGDSPPENSWMVSKDIASKAREKGKVFVDWLKEEDDEGDEGDSSDEDEDDD